MSLPDLTINSATISSNSIIKGYEYKIEYTLQNLGSDTARNFYSGVYLADKSPSEDDNVVELTGGSSKSFSYFLSSKDLSVGYHTLRFSVDFWYNDVSEINDQNNIKDIGFWVTAPDTSKPDLCY